jgi:flagellar biosynthesis protein FlhG
MMKQTAMPNAEPSATGPSVNKPSANRPKIIAIGGGKGGIGKTVIAASIGVGLAWLKKRTVVVDADLGGANLNAVFGLPHPDFTLKDFLDGRADSLESLLIKSVDIDNLSVLSGAPGAYGQANLKHGRKLKLLRHLQKLDADYVVLDLGAGSHFNVLDLFLAADTGIVLVNPDPLSILEGYDFVKHALFRKLARGLSGRADAVEAVLKTARLETFRAESSAAALLTGVRAVDAKAGALAERLIAGFTPYLLINKLNGTEDIPECLAVQIAAQEILTVAMEYAGCIHFDDSVLASVKKGVPFMALDPKTSASRDLADLVISKIVHRKRIEAMFDRHDIRRKLRKKWGARRETVMCSIECLYWEECTYKEGGYPCKLQHLAGIGGFQK